MYPYSEIRLCSSKIEIRRESYGASSVCSRDTIFTMVDSRHMKNKGLSNPSRKACPVLITFSQCPLIKVQYKKESKIQSPLNCMIKKKGGIGKTLDSDNSASVKQIIVKHRNNHLIGQQKKRRNQIREINSKKISKRLETQSGC